MKTLAILPVKRFRNAKQRLEPTYREGFRSALAQAMFGDVLSALRRSREVDSVLVVTGDRDAAEMARACGVDVFVDRSETGLTQAIQPAIAQGVEQGFRRVVLVSSDCPLVNSKDIDALLERAADDRLHVAIVGDRHGAGTNALVLDPPRAIEPRFGPMSLNRHVAQAESRSLDYSVETVESLAHDVDTVQDLEDLADEMDRRVGSAPMTRGVMRQLGRLKREPAGSAAR